MLAEGTAPGTEPSRPPCAAAVQALPLDVGRHEGVLLREADHRLRNVLAVVDAITRQTLRGSDTYRQLAESLSVRFSALASANDVFRAGDDTGATIGETVENALTPFGDFSGGRVSIGGPKIRLGASLTLALRLTVHELSTNALKHGALADEHGQLAIAWSYMGDARDAFRFMWTEASARTVRPPTRTGFGTRMIGHVLASHALEGPELRYEADGVRFAFTARAHTDAA